MRTSFGNLYLEMHFSPTIEIISLVRQFVSSFYERSLVDPETTSRVALATHELLENACKYSIDGETKIRIELGAGRSTIRIRLTNRASQEHIASLQEQFAMMNQFPDPADYYRRMMVAAVRRNDGSGLGLARLRAEADMVLAMEVDGDRLSIVADTTLAAGPPPGTPA